VLVDVSCCVDDEGGGGHGLRRIEWDVLSLRLSGRTSALRRFGHLMRLGCRGNLRFFQESLGLGIVLGLDLLVVQEVFLRGGEVVDLESLAV
jgi:hypothetical protein